MTVIATGIHLKSLFTSEAFSRATLVRCQRAGCERRVLLDDQVPITTLEVASFRASVELRRRAVIALGWVIVGGVTMCGGCYAEIRDDLTDSAIAQWEWERDEALRVEVVR